MHTLANIEDPNEMPHNINTMGHTKFILSTRRKNPLMHKVLKLFFFYRFFFGVFFCTLATQICGTFEENV